jgi:hypothetical protein
MALFGRWLVYGGIAMALFAHGAAQTSPPEAKLPSRKTIEGWLRGDEPRLVAWGAHDALLAGDRSLIPNLLSLASQWQPLPQAKADHTSTPLLSQEQIDARDAMTAVVDALIQMKVPVPAETLRNLAPDFSNATAILLSRLSPDDAEPLALDFYHASWPHGYGLQYVSAALLAQRPPQGFAADLLKSITVRAEIFVVHPGDGNFGGGSAGDCVSTQNVRKDWPSTGHYRLLEENSMGALLVVGGFNPAYAVRELSTSYLDPSCPSLYLGPEQRQRLIAEMLGIAPESMPWQTNPAKTIEFISHEQFDFELHQLIDREEAKYRETAEALASRGLLNDAEEQESSPRLRVAISDMRGSAAADDPIIEIADLPPNVECSNSPWK